MQFWCIDDSVRQWLPVPNTVFNDTPFVLAHPKRVEQDARQFFASASSTMVLNNDALRDCSNTSSNRSGRSLNT